jgi:hypothetical protein
MIAAIRAEVTRAWRAAGHAGFEAEPRSNDGRMDLFCMRIVFVRQPDLRSQPGLSSPELQNRQRWINP